MSLVTAAHSALPKAPKTAPQTPRSVEIRSHRGLIALDFAELWGHRELLWFLILRELKIRYRQAAIGAGWAVLQPVIAVAIFAVIFGRFAKLPSGGAPYALFAFSGVLPWTYFAEAVRRSSTGLVGDSDLLRKIYFPRLLAPVALTIAPLADFAAGLAVLLVLYLWYGMVPGLQLLLLPLFILPPALLALAIGLWLGPLSVRFRDVMHALPFLIQVWLYASPVAYPSSIVPERWRLLYSLNPMVGVIEGFRWILLGGARPDLTAMGISGAIILASLAGGLVYFRKMERSFADVI